MPQSQPRRPKCIWRDGRSGWRGRSARSPPRKDDVGGLAPCRTSSASGAACALRIDREARLRRVPHEIDVEAPLFRLGYVAAEAQARRPGGARRAEAQSVLPAAARIGGALRGRGSCCRRRVRGHPRDRRQDRLPERRRSAGATAGTGAGIRLRRRPGRLLGKVTSDGDRDGRCRYQAHAQPRQAPRRSDGLGARLGGIVFSDPRRRACDRLAAAWDLRGDHAQCTGSRLPRRLPTMRESRLSVNRALRDRENRRRTSTIERIGRPRARNRGPPSRSTSGRTLDGGASFVCCSPADRARRFKAPAPGRWT